MMCCEAIAQDIMQRLFHDTPITERMVISALLAHALHAPRSIDEQPQLRFGLFYDRHSLNVEIYPSRIHWRERSDLPPGPSGIQ